MKLIDFMIHVRKLEEEWRGYELSICRPEDIGPPKDRGVPYMTGVMGWSELYNFLLILRLGDLALRRRNEKHTGKPWPAIRFSADSCELPGHGEQLQQLRKECGL